MHTHQTVFHLIAYPRYQMYSIAEERLEQLAGDIALVPEEFSEHFFEEALLLQGSPIVHIPLADHEVEYFPLVVYDKMELEPMEPAHGRFACFGNALENLVVPDPLALADPDGCGVHKRDSCAVAQTAGLHENSQGKQNALAKLHESVVGNSPGKLCLHMHLYIKIIVVFEAPETADLECDKDRYYLAVAHCGWASRTLA